MTPSQTSVGRSLAEAKRLANAAFDFAFNESLLGRRWAGLPDAEAVSRLDDLYTALLEYIQTMSRLDRQRAAKKIPPQRDRHGLHAVEAQRTSKRPRAKGRS